MSNEQSYSPCRDGIHVCGGDPTETYPVTVANIAGASREAFETARKTYGYTPADTPHGRDIDLVVDFMRGGDIVDDFCIRRQMLEAMLMDLAPTTGEAAA